MADVASQIDESPATSRLPAEAKQSREVSRIEFPYTGLDLAMVLAKAVHDLGNTCEWSQLGGKLDMAPDGGGFRGRLAAARTFGLITFTSRTVTLTPLGTQINDPDQVAAAKVEAFLNVPLYKAIYEQYLNGTLPPADGLENAMVSLGVSKKQKEKARQAFQRSATEAGFFGYGANRLVRPTTKALKKTDKPADPAGGESEETEIEKGKRKDGGEPPSYHPFIVGLLGTLPATSAQKTEWPLQDRLDWLETAAGIFNLIYKKAADEKGSLKVTLEA